MSAQAKSKFTPYARQKILRFLFDLLATRADMTWSGMAGDITEMRGIPFQRINFNRLRDGQLGDSNIDIIVEWIEAKFDADIRSKLVPQAIFDEVGRSQRDYYFYLPPGHVVEDLNEQILEEYAGVYLVAPSSDANTYLPLPFLRRFFADPKAFPDFKGAGRSLDIKQYIGQRCFLVLQPTIGSYFYAAEFPMSLLVPPNFGAMDHRMVCEGIAVVSSNSIHVFMRDCLSRVPKSYAIVISPKSSALRQAANGLSFYVGVNAYDVRKDWPKLDAADIAHLKQEHGSFFDEDFYLYGPSQESASPIAEQKRRVGLTYSAEYVFYKRPKDLLEYPDKFFVLPEIYRKDMAEKIVESPLSIGAFE